ncbi:Crp/Fnr family transcriptional regulator [Actinomadura craniellae]|uniref:Crp/Fnr family transcriptional regulator n=1 Tax=Actinomadura craniellae TaxID=2231787 RepID=A0A365H4R8_9ACTN|nr:Crp/Fnr family transcriptional regulator [Actinomadura craniellae]RAY13992.1 Crp/Fnr family transcriptional regulator [Actinomadura craniellae]
MTERNHRPHGGFWRSLGPAEQQALLGISRPRTFTARTALCHQGEASDHIIVIRDGWAKVTVTGADGSTVVLAVRGPGDLVGEMATIGHRHRSATVTALNTIRALVVPSARFNVFLREHPAALQLVSSNVVRRLDDADRRLQERASSSGAQRLARLLFDLSELSDSYARTGAGGGIEISPPLSQQELGSWVGASRETVARALQDWRRRGLVRTGWRRITVLDRPGLSALADGRVGS